MIDFILRNQGIKERWRPKIPKFPDSLARKRNC